jgi:hypothetical protein
MSATGVWPVSGRRRGTAFSFLDAHLVGLVCGTLQIAKPDAFLTTFIHFGIGVWGKKLLLRNSDSEGKILGGPNTLWRRWYCGL